MRNVVKEFIGKAIESKEIENKIIERCDLVAIHCPDRFGYSPDELAADYDTYCRCYGIEEKQLGFFDWLGELLGYQGIHTSAFNIPKNLHHQYAGCGYGWARFDSAYNMLEILYSEPGMLESDADYEKRHKDFMSDKTGKIVSGAFSCFQFCS